ncbi:kinase-like domain-containing protein [Cantharellus anzutake]|uniref:kinase-like domain-containing protein n=1 Tax=Cantharellus anzutake TaxID=1750568 RepID=UPI001903AB03|nr:kinase-like domain-containing protein [Cantharellus anzutake]KAF8337438.1 kinase-like domain-containing protein [Cantharellus anzutake]
MLMEAIDSYRATGRSIPSIDSTELTATIQMVRGEFAVIWKCVRAARFVAVKVYQVSNLLHDVQRVFDRVVRDIEICKRIQNNGGHKNLVPFIGCCGPKGRVPYIISAWMPNGDARSYVRDRDGDETECLKIFIDMVEGLGFLHDIRPNFVAHGNLKASNVLIDEDGSARLADFALASVRDEILDTGSRPPPVQWCAPERLRGEEGSSETSKASDIYSFSCTILEV